MNFRKRKRWSHARVARVARGRTRRRDEWVIYRQWVLGCEIVVLPVLRGTKSDHCNPDKLDRNGVCVGLEGHVGSLGVLFRSMRWGTDCVEASAESARPTDRPLTTPVRRVRGQPTDLLRTVQNICRRLGKNARCCPSPRVSVPPCQDARVADAHARIVGFSAVCGLYNAAAAPPPVDLAHVTLCAARWD